MAEDSMQDDKIAEKFDLQKLEKDCTGAEKEAAKMSAMAREVCE